MLGFSRVGFLFFFSDRDRSLIFRVVVDFLKGREGIGFFIRYIYYYLLSYFGFGLEGWVSEGKSLNLSIVVCRVTTFWSLTGRGYDGGFVG